MAPRLTEIPPILMPVSIQTEANLERTLVANIPTLDIAKTNATEDMLEDAIEHTIGRADNEVMVMTPTKKGGKGRHLKSTLLYDCDSCSKEELKGRCVR